MHRKRLNTYNCYIGLSEEGDEGKVTYCYSSNVFGFYWKEILGMREDSRIRATGVVGYK